MESDDNTGELDRFEGKPENYLIYLDMFGQNFVKPGLLDSALGDLQKPEVFIRKRYGGQTDPTAVKELIVSQLPIADHGDIIQIIQSNDQN